MDWTEKALEDGVLLYDFENGKILDLEEYALPVAKRARSVSARLTSASLPVIPVFYRGIVSPASLEPVQRDYDDYREVHKGRNEVSWKASADVATLKELLE